MNSKKILMEAERFDAKLNLYDSFESLPTMDEAYPKHDGTIDAEAEATLMQLIQRLSSIKRTCEDVVYKINRVLEQEL